MKLQATKRLNYAGRTVQPGEVFDASPKFARVLIAVKRARAVPAVPEEAKPARQAKAEAPAKAAPAQEQTPADTPAPPPPARAKVKAVTKTAKPSRSAKAKVALKAAQPPEAPPAAESATVQVQPENLMTLTCAELRNIAVREGVKLDGDERTDQLVAKITENRRGGGGYQRRDMRAED
jgi:hypothetical protein